MSAPSPRATAPLAVQVDSEGRNVAFHIDGREYVFSAGTADVSDRVELLERWAEHCRLAAALRRCHAQLQAEQRRQAEAAARGAMRFCSLCGSANAAARTACHWCGSPT